MDASVIMDIDLIRAPGAPRWSIRRAAGAEVVAQRGRGPTCSSDVSRCQISRAGGDEMINRASASYNGHTYFM